MLLLDYNRLEEVFFDFMYILKNCVKNIYDFIIRRIDLIKVRKVEVEFGWFGFFGKLRILVC